MKAGRPEHGAPGRARRAKLPSARPEAAESGAAGSEWARSAAVVAALAQAIFSGTPEAIIVVDDAGRIAEFNPAAEAVFGWRREDAIGKDMARLLIPTRRRRAYRSALNQFWHTGDTGSPRFHRRSATTALRADGSEFPVESTLLPLTVAGARFCCEFIRDTSDIAQAASALAMSEQRFRLLSTLAPVGILQTDANGATVFVNDRWCALTGLSRDEALGKGWAGVLGREYAEIVTAIWEDTSTAGQEFQTELPLRPDTASATWVQSAAVPLRDESGHMVGYLGTMTDISARKAAEAEREEMLAAERDARRKAAENAERLVRLVTALPAAVLIEDECRRIVLVNDYFCELFQISAPSSDLTGASAAEVIDETKRVAADPDRFAFRIRQIIAAHELVADEEIVFADGRIYDRDYVPVIVGQERHGLLWLYWEVTERRAADRQRERILVTELQARKVTDAARRKLAEQNQRLRELDELKSQFMATLSHELRSPLTSIVSFTGLLREVGPTSPEATEFLDIIERNSDRLLRLVSDLLLLGHLEAGSLPLELAPQSAAELVQEAVLARTAPAQGRGVTIELESEDGPPLRLDRLRMLQVIDNLISNAIKFSDPGSIVRVSAHYEGNEWRIDVADSGIGIPTEEQDRIFERFFRASNARIEAVPGTGLGLSVVQAIVELHGGRLEMRSTPGKGTTFSVFLRSAH
ncbi:MAG TPA: PAS domain-containing sensor histidine kinase [Streptosporangiaceae bacterium]|nr:PAS domain-containing sensor histidine kinase [Streptosporangiaceae bacterium]